MSRRPFAMVHRVSGPQKGFSQRGDMTSKLIFLLILATFLASVLVELKAAKVWPVTKIADKCETSDKGSELDIKETGMARWKKILIALAIILFLSPPVIAFVFRFLLWLYFLICNLLGYFFDICNADKLPVI